MRDTPQLEPETKERWAGVRSKESMVSEIQSEVNTLRTRVSGIRSYQDFLEARLNNSDTFDDYETELITRADGRPNVDEADATAARDIIDGPFNSLSDHAGDPSQETGVFGLSDYDAYRQYLINNGVAEIDADEHNQTIQRLFTSGDVFLEAARGFTTYDELEQWLVDNGWTAVAATEFVDKLRDRFGSYSDFLDRITSDIETIKDLLNALDHAAGGPGGGPRVERRGNQLYLLGAEIHMEQLDADAISNPEAAGELSWTIDSAPLSTPVGEPFAIAASGSDSNGASFETSVSLVINGEVADVKTVEASDGAATVRFERTFSSPGEYDVVVGDSGSFTITAELEV